MSDHFLDITQEVCPITFVRTKLALERAAPGETLEVRLRGAEPLENVPRSVREHGHAVVSLVPENATRNGPGDVWRLVLRKA